MATYRVIPLPDSTDMRGSWQVTKNGRFVSRHRKKTAAKRTAKDEAGKTDTIVVHRLDGTVQGSIPG